MVLDIATGLAQGKWPVRTGHFPCVGRALHSKSLAPTSTTHGANGCGAGGHTKVHVVKKLLVPQKVVQFQFQSNIRP